MREKDFPVEVVELKGQHLLQIKIILDLTATVPDSVLDFSWEPKGERFAIVSSSDPNLGNPGPGITIKTDVSFYQLDHSKNDFRMLRGPCPFSTSKYYSSHARNFVFQNK